MENIEKIFDKNTLECDSGLKVIDAVETYLKSECRDIYKNNSLNMIFDKVRSNKEMQFKMIDIINDFVQ